jgi:hypothetical protein
MDWSAVRKVDPVSDKLRDQKCVSILEVRPDGFVKDARE